MTTPATVAPPLSPEERARKIFSGWLPTNQERAVAAAIAEAEQAARLAQMEADCQAVCGYCYASIHQADMMPAASLSVSAAYVAGGEPEWMWVHDIRHASGETQTDDCKASAIRAAYAERQKEGEK